MTFGKLLNSPEFMILLPEVVLLPRGIAGGIGIIVIICDNLKLDQGLHCAAWSFGLKELGWGSWLSPLGYKFFFCFSAVHVSKPGPWDWPKSWLAGM